MKKSRALLSAAAVCLMLLLLVFSQQAKAAAYDALRLCAGTLIPSLFPFYAAAGVLVQAELPNTGRLADKLMQTLFGLTGAAASALLLGLLGGYPIGASTAAALYRRGDISKQDAVALSRFANNAGPAFIVGAAGLAVFNSVRIGLVLYFIHALSAVLTGWLLRRRGFHASRVCPRRAASEAAAARVLPDAVGTAVRSMLMICAYVLLFSVVGAVVKPLPAAAFVLHRLNAVIPAAEPLLSGLLEVSCGVLALKGLQQNTAFIYASFLLGFGGLCVFCQSAALLSEAGLPTAQCIGGKLLQGLIAAALACLRCAFSARSATYLLGFSALFSLSFLFLKIGGRKNANGLL